MPFHEDYLNNNPTCDWHRISSGASLHFSLEVLLQLPNGNTDPAEPGVYFAADEAAVPPNF